MGPCGRSAAAKQSSLSLLIERSTYDDTDTQTHTDDIERQLAAVTWRATISDWLETADTVIDSISPPTPACSAHHSLHLYGSSTSTHHLMEGSRRAVKCRGHGDHTPPHNTLYLTRRKQCNLHDHFACTEQWDLARLKLMVIPKLDLNNARLSPRIFFFICPPKLKLTTV